MPVKTSSVDKIIDFIYEHIPKKATLKTKIPFKGFHYVDVVEALKILKQNGDYKDVEPYDLPGTKYMWNLKSGEKNYSLARHGTKKLIERIRDHPENRHRPLEQILPELSKEDFDFTPINRLQTTLNGMIQRVYDASPHYALIDLINNTPQLNEYRNFKKYDMKVSRNNTWVSKAGKLNYKLARNLTEKLLITLKMLFGKEDFRDILQFATRARFLYTPVNKYGTTCQGMLQTVYGNSPKSALRDLARNNPCYKKYLKDIENLKHHY